VGKLDESESTLQECLTIMYITFLTVFVFITKVTDVSVVAFRCRCSHA
jgi:hypothetical protein